jgi:ferredoxin
MFQQVKVPVLGVIENMSRFLCSDCGKEHDIFGFGGVREAAQREGVRFLGDIPIVPTIRIAGDTGAPVVLTQPEIEKYPVKFDIDLGICVFCGYCVEACLEDVIRMDIGILEFSSYTRNGMILTKEMLPSFEPHPEYYTERKDLELKSQSEYKQEPSEARPAAKGTRPFYNSVVEESKK